MEAVAQAHCLTPKVIVPNINLTKLNDIEATWRILQDRPAITIIDLLKHSVLNYAA